MNNEFNPSYQYNRCSYKGICSINPTTASLQEVILLYLKHTSVYGLKLFESGFFDKRIRNLILNTMSILSSTYEISENDFALINSAFKKELPIIISEYKKKYKDDNKIDNLEIENLVNYNRSFNDYIRLGEKELNDRSKCITPDVGHLYKILFILVKSMCINILTYESYGIEIIDEFVTILKIFDFYNLKTNDKNELKNIIIKTAFQDFELMKKIRDKQNECYGKQSATEVSFSTTKGKCVLVVGSNLRELEWILDKLKNIDIDVYTHDNMIIAHTFEKFREYQNLKGQFGQGIENCLLDFSTFPGPIILTRHSLYNIENLYRGRLFSTDFAYSKGVVSIQNNDLSEVINAAKESKGFKTGKNCRSETIGISYEEATCEINKKLSEKDYSKIFIFGIEGYTKEERVYFAQLLKHIPKDNLVISFSCCEPQKNLICFNIPSDTLSMLKISEYVIKKFQKETIIFVPYFDRHMLSLVIYLNSLENCKFYVGTWNNTILNPNILEGLKSNFGVNEITSEKKDLLSILNN